ncbi:putative Thymus-specific serine protease [Blattamonas nauphoetae]|uniref:Thymus-specific serine protease n=1 Tax=Blattamonas nauphoetae TaxID=2049346 RepID=A0ABQ9XYF3_9EUKA|nr:putative Thymus-specific serine protease [Blattamonas nauphoetae]
MLSTAISLITLCSAYLKFNPDFVSRTNQTLRSNAEYKTFKQKLDHFDPQSTTTFDQRYVINTLYYKNSHTLILDISGESVMPANAASSGFVNVLAEQFEAVAVSLEHRYYGKSHPFAALTTDNLKYLSSQQALADLATFVDFLRAGELKSHNIKHIIVTGGSYAGAMSAWFRTMYPHITFASIASSGPVLAQMDFPEYDQAISEAIDAKCRAAVQAATKEVEAAVVADYEKERETLKCTQLSNKVDYLYVVADAVSYAIQYNQDDGPAKKQTIKLLCDTLDDESIPTLKERMNKFVGTIFEYLETDCFDFSSSRERLSSDVVSETQSSRQWMYQVCTEFGYFQVAPAENSLRSALIDSQYHLDLCKAIFGKELVPDIEGINRRYGGLDVKGNNIIFSNGEKDPWKMLSILNASLATRTSTAGTSNGGHVVPEDGRVERQKWGVFVIKDGSHCVDLHTPAPSDSQPLKNVRRYEIEMLKDWLAQNVVPVGFKFTDPVVLASVVTIGVMVVAFIAIVIVLGATY